MSNTNIYSDAFYQNREVVIRNKIGKQLDSLRKDISQLNSPCTVRMMKIPKGMTWENLPSLDSDSRQAILAAILYNDAFWRLESAYLMLTIGMLTVTYSNLRSCLESVVKAHIVENLDSEAIKFLKTGQINPTKISGFIPEEYDNAILKMREAFSDWGTHSHLKAVQLSALFGPSSFDKMVANTTINRPQILSDAFADAARTCIKAMGDVFVMFMWIMSKGTKYSRTT